jgi:O-acetyl-ADP-ribose deacetylase (regulator of RNase III)
MIKIVKGDLLDATEDIIGHQVNCQAKMNSGVAKSIRGRFPEAYEEYIAFTEPFVKAKLQEDLLGNVKMIGITGESKFVANMYGQLNYGYDGKQYTDTNALFKCFRDLRNTAEFYGLSVALPYMIGCYRGGADWKIVEDHLLTAFDGYEVTLYKKHMG